MAQVSKYRYLLNQYPETVQKEQFRIICHISKRTARYLLQSGLVPCVQSGKKTRNYTIKMKDIVRYLERREIHPEKYKLPPGSYTGTLITNLLLDESLPDTNEFIQKIGSVDLIPSSRSLTVAEANLLMTPDSNDYLAALLNPLRLSYDYIIVDTNPSLGSLTINALTAADEVIIPIDPELFALTGLQALVDTIQKIKRKLNPSIEIGGILFTKCNKRTNLYRRTYGQVTKAFQSLPIFNCQIPYTVKVGDANSYGMSVMELEQANPASLAYLELAKEVLANA